MPPSLFYSTSVSLQLLGSYWLLVFAVFVYVLGRDPIGRAEAERETSRDPGAVGRRALWRTACVAGACLVGCFAPLAEASAIAMVLGLVAGLLTIARGRAHKLPVPAALIEVVAFGVVFVITIAVPSDRIVWEGLLFGVAWNGELQRIKDYAPQIMQLFGTLAFFAVAGRGGNLVVRSILDGSSLDQVGEAEQSSTPVIEARQVALGRTIGALERWLLIVFVVVGGYTALGVLVAAKGFVRVRDAGTDPVARRFAEYVVLGTLASLLVAVALGLALRATYWPKLDL